MQNVMIRSLAGLTAVAFTATALIAATPAQTLSDKPDIHYVPTPTPVVARMLELAEPKSGEYLIDLGSGDGRIPITAAKRYGVTAQGIDIDPQRISEANANASKEGVTDKVKFVQENLFQTDISKADVVTLYLLETLNAKLRPRLLAELRPGARVVSHAFTMGDWRPDHHEVVSGANVYFWTVPAKVEGQWKLQNGSEAVVDLSLRQRYQEVSGVAKIDGRDLPVEQASLKGAELSFRIGEQSYKGRVEGNTIVPAADGKWRAERS